ncbi:hypothetical protein AMATHDRAFT_6876 [Amanita thiersii Skay4041]|uniref:Uncharacterized protein n=1 Tax=Amanita thiersii Skay4041 TaxID=703135 RepID=A0A2A9N8Y3_9AGAR|nr:hypothetical protein AMATHDRAFT_6876 [Amanita thiersii Skay4041]
MHSFVNSLYNIITRQIQTPSISSLAASSRNKSDGDGYAHADSHEHENVQDNAHSGSRASWRDRGRPPVGVVYCHHDRSGSTGSTEYWVWKGPGHGMVEDKEGEELEEEWSESEEDIEEHRVEDEIGTVDKAGVGSENDDHHVPIESVTGHNASVAGLPCLSPRLQSLEATTDAPGVCEPDLLVAQEDVLHSRISDVSSSSAEDDEELEDLAGEAFTAVLRSARQATGASDGKILGLGICNIKRKDDSCAFDGLGVVHVHSTPWKTSLGSVYINDYDEEVGPEEPGLQEDEYQLSETFLKDLETHFLSRLLSTSAVVNTQTAIRVSNDDNDKGSGTPRTNTPTVTAIPNFAHHIKRVFNPRSKQPSATSSPRRGGVGTSLSQSSSTSSFVRRTCSALHSRSNSNSTRSTSPWRTPNNSNVPPSSSGRSFNSEKEPKVIALNLGSVRDLSNVGTISSDLKKRCKAQSQLTTPMSTPILTPTPMPMTSRSSFR